MHIEIFTKKETLVSAFAHTFAIIRILYKALDINSPSETSPKEEAANKKKEIEKQFAKELFECDWPFCGIGVQKVKHFPPHNKLYE